MLPMIALLATRKSSFLATLSLFLLCPGVSGWYRAVTYPVAITTQSDHARSARLAYILAASSSKAALRRRALFEWLPARRTPPEPEPDRPESLFSVDGHQGHK